MKARVKLFFSYTLFWIVFFVLARVLFLVYHADKSAELPIGDIILAMAHGMRLDLSMTGYFMLIPGLLLTLTLIKPAKVIYQILAGYTILLIFLCSFIVIADLEMYAHWGFRLDATPLLYIGEDTPLAITPSKLLSLALIWVIFFVAAAYMYVRLVHRHTIALPDASWKYAVIMLLLTGAMIIPIRGTFGVAPINTGMVYFHPSNLFANHAAINVVWNTGYALRKSGNLKYPDNYYDKNRTQEYFNHLYTSGPDTVRVLRNTKPNIILLIMESYTYSFIEPLGGVAGVAPNFSRLCDEGILFTNMYASGDRTDKGIVSILSGYPAQPVSSIIKYPKKTQTLPFLNQKFKQMGYHTGFTYGGNIDFANFRSYLSNARFDNITHSDHFPAELNNSKWGVHDGYVFEKFFSELEQVGQPFFKVMLTLSSHEPFDVPMPTVIEGSDDASRFMNSAHYTDKALGEFIEKAKTTSWWDNTLIVITADHGHPLPNNAGTSNPKRFKIPMLWLGGALNTQGKTIDTFTSQTDIANTILGQVSKPDPAFLFSQNALGNPLNDFSVYIYNNGFGYVDSALTVVYDNVGKSYMIQEGVKNDRDLELGKAYLQTLYNDFNNR